MYCEEMKFYIWDRPLLYIEAFLLCPLYRVSIKRDSTVLYLIMPQKQSQLTTAKYRQLVIILVINNRVWLINNRVWLINYTCH